MRRSFDGASCRTARVVVVVAASFLVLPLLEPWPEAQQRVDTIFDALLVLVVAGAARRFISALVDVLGQRDMQEQRLPIKFLGQALQLTLRTYTGVACLSVLSGKDVASADSGVARALPVDR